MQSHRVIYSAAAVAMALTASARGQQWLGYAGDPQHSAVSSVETQPLNGIKWITPVDTNPQYSGDELFVHYGSPMITAANTVIVPVKDSNNSSFFVNAFDGTTGALKWSQTSDYTLPPQNPNWPNYFWVPSYSPTITPQGAMYWPGAGGTVYKRSGLDASGSVAPTQLAFYGINNYNADKSSFNSHVVITTGITTDAAGNIYFGFTTDDVPLPGINGGNAVGSGLARISAAGVGSYVLTDSVKANGIGMYQVAYNSAPAISKDGSTVYALLSDGDFGFGRLVSFNSTTLAPINNVALTDPKTGQNLAVPNESTASVLVGPDGDVYIGLTGVPFRGYLEHFSADLTVKKPAGAFGWDVTPSVVPASMVPSYHGKSSYLLMIKYNSYDDGKNKIAILDPSDTQIDTTNGSTGATVMKEVLSILGPTPNPALPGGVYEWCINTAVVDPATDSVLVNSEDGKLYRWNLVSNTLTQVVTLSGGLGESYTPTLVGPDGTVYAINNAKLAAVGVATLAAVWNSGGTGLTNWSNATRWSTAVVPNNGNPVTQWYDVTIDTTAVTLDVDATIHSLTLLSGSLTGTHNLSFSNAIISGAYQVTGLTTISGVAAFNANTHTAGAITGTGTLILDTGATLTSDAVTIRNLTLFGQHTIRAGSPVSKIVMLTIGGSTDNWTGKLDLKNNSLIVEAEGDTNKTAEMKAIANQIVSGSKNNWTGNGITSSMLAGDVTHSIGIYDNALLGLTNFGGGTGNVDGNSILLTMARIGDTNFDGHVNDTDLNLIANNFNLTGASNWAQGDLNGDGIVNSQDLSLVVAQWDSVGIATSSAIWNSAGTGLTNWSNATRWSTAVVPNNGNPVGQLYDVTIDTTAVTLDVDATIHSFTLNSGSLTGTHNLSFSNGIISGAYHVTGLTTISGVAVFNANTHTAGAITGTGTLILDTGATLTSDAVTIRNLKLFGQQTIRAGSPVSKIVSLTIGGSTDNWTGKLDLKNNSLIVEADVSNKTAQMKSIANQIVSGSKNNWTGNGITSSTLAGDVTHSIGLFDNALLGLTNFGGGTGNVDANSILLAVALMGDTNLDGHVNATDLNLISDHFNLTGASNWTQGDLNGDGIVDSLDVNIVVSHWDAGQPYVPLVNYTPTFSYILTPAPEPGTLGLLALAVPVMMRRKRR